jgi:dihydrofolate synthase / folylpolyglutamate synthase
VAHNRESARYLGKKLAYFKAQGFKIHALIAMLSDKDKVSVIKEVIDYVDDWSCASLNGPRGDTGQNLLALLPKPSQSRAKTYNSVNEGLMKIMPNTNSDTLVIVFGSFFTVAEAINCLKK